MAKPDADIALVASAVNRGIDAHQFAAQVNQRTARITEVDRGVGLDEVFDGFDTEPGAPERRDDTRGHGLTEPERVTDRHHEITDSQRTRVGHRDIHQVVGAHLDQGHVGIAVATDDLARNSRPSFSVTLIS